MSSRSSSGSASAARAPSKEDAASRAGLRGALGGVLSALGALAAGASGVVLRAAPYASWAVDASWMLASSAVLLALPIVIEIQREATVRVLQHQRELENQQIQVRAALQTPLALLRGRLPRFRHAERAGRGRGHVVRARAGQCRLRVTIVPSISSRIPPLHPPSARLYRVCAGASADAVWRALAAGAGARKSDRRRAAGRPRIITRGQAASRPLATICYRAVSHIICCCGRHHALCLLVGARCSRFAGLASRGAVALRHSCAASAACFGACVLWRRTLLCLVFRRRSLSCRTQRVTPLWPVSVDAPAVSSAQHDDSFANHGHARVCGA